MIRLSDHLTETFGEKVYKLSLSSGCTCPNRDGKVGYGGCTFCSQGGSGEFASKPAPIDEQIEEAKKLIRAKSDARLFIAYFQSYTNTYGDVSRLKELYKRAVSREDIVALSLGTRPDCLGPEVMDMLKELSAIKPVWIELGLQTSNEKTGRLINRCYTNEDYVDAVKRIREIAPDIHLVTHLIFGLPDETEEDMLESVKFVVGRSLNGVEGRSLTAFGLKITSLYVLQNTRLAQMYESGEYEPLTKEEYFALLQKALPLLPENCVVHRLTGDPPKSLLISPAWPKDKKRVMNKLKEIISDIHP